MDDILQALAKMLNMTVDEVSSLLTTFKGNAPQIYEMFVKEKMFYDLFSLFQIMSIVIFSISAVVFSSFNSHIFYIRWWFCLFL